MEGDLKGILDAIREENASAHVETRGQFEVIAEGLRRELQTVASAHGETCRHFDVVAEGLRREIQLVAEGIATNSEKIDRIDAKGDQSTSDLDTRVTRLEATASRWPRS